MNQINSAIRLIVLFTVILLSATSVWAQDVKTHTVERGETLSSIATKYGVSQEEIVKLNPEAAQFLYVGMELKIPGKKVTAPTTAPLDTTRNMITPKAETTSTLLRENKQNNRNPSDFTHFGVFYQSSFEDAGHGFYGIGGIVHAPENWGINFYAGTNMGIIDSSYASILFTIGPAWGYMLNNSTLLSTSFNFIGGSVGQGERKDSKFTWGLSLAPKLIFSLSDKCYPFAGIDFQWSKHVKEISCGFIVGIGFSI